MSGEPLFEMTFTEDEMYNIGHILAMTWLDEPSDVSSQEAYVLAQQFERVRAGKSQRKNHDD